jgi:hypothetical protein
VRKTRDERDVEEEQRPEADSSKGEAMSDLFEDQMREIREILDSAPKDVVLVGRLHSDNVRALVNEVDRLRGENDRVRGQYEDLLRMVDELRSRVEPR